VDPTWADFKAIVFPYTPNGNLDEGPETTTRGGVNESLKFLLKL
jgi:hypothetical protein